MPSDIEALLTCDDDDVHVVYQGELAPGRYIRARIPVPSGEVSGMVNLAATICFGSATDPENPSAYTRSGVEVVFRPHTGRRPKRRNSRSGELVESRHAKTRPFFSARPYAGEAELREDGQKWETTLFGHLNMKWSSLSEPVFELHHNSRVNPGRPAAGEAVPYAMIVSLRAPEVKDLYNRVFHRYKGLLEPLAPVLEIPVRT